MSEFIDFSVFQIESIMPFYLVLALVMGVSFFAGTFIKGVFHLNKYRWLSFATPIGFFFYMAVLQIGYMMITYESISTGSFYVERCLNYTRIVTTGILFVSIIGCIFVWKDIKATFHWKNLLKIVLAIIIFTILLNVWKDVIINYRQDDINFYEPFITERLTEVKSSLLTYNYQGYYVFLAVLKDFMETICGYMGYAMPADIVYVIWMPSMFTLWLVSFAITDFEGYCEEKLKSIPLGWVAWAAVAIITMLDYWYFQTPYTGNSLRRLTLLIIFPLVEHMITEEKWWLAIPASIVLGGALSVSSTAFFTGMIFLYGATLYSLIMRKKDTFLELLILVLYPLSYAYCYLEVYQTPIKYALAALVIIALAFKFIKPLRKVENYLFIPAIVVLVAVPIGIVVLNHMGYPDAETFETMLQSRSFADTIANYDQVPDLIQTTSVSNVLQSISGITTLQYNIDSDSTIISSVYTLYWLFFILAVVFVWKSKDFNTFIAGVTVLTFFNPYVYEVVGSYLTGMGYWRITDLLFCMPVLTGFIFSISSWKEFIPNKIVGYVITGVVTVLFVGVAVLKYQSFSVPNYMDKSDEKYDDFNMMYKTYNTYIDISNQLIEILKEDEDIDLYGDTKIKIASQIYGFEFFIEDTEANVVNTLENRYAFTTYATSEYQRMFAYRLPGFDDLDEMDVDYRHACSLAVDSGTEYVVLDGQYDTDLAFGLWPCSNVKEDSDIWMIIKIDQEYWPYTLADGYTLRYKTDGNNTEGVDTEWYEEQDMEIPEELPEDKAEQEAAIAEMQAKK